MVLRDFKEPLYNSQYAKRVVGHTETAEFIPDDTELTSLFIQVHDIIRNKLCLIHIMHILSHTGLLGSLAQGNAEIDQLVIRRVLKTSEFHKNHHVNGKGLKSFLLHGNKLRRL